MNFLEIWFRSLFSARRRKSLRNELFTYCLTLHLENLKT